MGSRKTCARKQDTHSRNLCIFLAVLLSRTWDSRTRTRTWCPSTRTRTRTWKLVLGDPGGQGLSSGATTLQRNYVWPNITSTHHHQVRLTWTWTWPGTMASKPFVTQSLQDDGAWYFAWYCTLTYSVLKNFPGLELPRTRTRTWKLVLEDKDFPRGQQHWLIIAIIIIWYKILQRVSPTRMNHVKGVNADHNSDDKKIYA